MRISIFLLSAAVIMALSGCGDMGNSSGGSSSYNNIFGSLQMKASLTTPCMKMKDSMKAPVRDPDRASTWLTNSYSNMREIFFTFMQYDPANMPVPVDSHNIYFVLYSLDQIFEISSMAPNLPSPKQIACPFVFNDAYADTPESYDHFADFTSDNGHGTYINHTTIAFNTNGGYYNGLAGYRIAQSDGYGMGTIKFQYNDTSGDIRLRLAMAVYYTNGTMSGQIYGVRCKINGNMQDHDFFVHIQVGNVLSQCLQLAGKGFSRGAGNYYVVYVTNWNAPGSFGYYQVPSDADEGWFIGNWTNHTDSPLAGPGFLTNDTNHYGQDVEAYRLTNWFTNSFYESSFSNGGILTAN